MSVPHGIPGTWIQTFSAYPRDLVKWEPWPDGTGPNNNNEIACYVPANVTVGRTLAGRVLNMRVTNVPCISRWGTQLPYSGAYIQSRFTQAFGAFEARINLPAAANGGIANWPAFWLCGQNWPTDGEIDIMEGLGGRNHSTFHYGTPEHPLSEPATPAHNNAGPGWHTFGVHWTASNLTFYLDGKPSGVVNGTYITSQPMRIILDNAVARGSSVNTVPSNLQVRWVRAWKEGKSYG